MSDYLWDKEGEPDPEVAELEALLSPLAYRGRPVLPPPRRRVSRVWISAALVATAALVALVATRPWRPKPTPPAPGASWAAVVTGSDATAGGRAIAGAARLAVGAWLETGSGHATLRVADLGTLELGPGTRARIVKSGATRQELELDRGTLVATIAAPPRQFVIDTKHAVVTDLGCAFTLAVDEAGQGRLTVTAGQVAMASGAGAREVVVPAGAECAVTTRGPGTPYLSDASAGFRDALARYAADPSTLRALLAEARPQDLITLRALVSAAGDADQRLLHERMSELDGTRKPTPTPAPAPQPQRHPTRAIHKITKPTPHASPARNVEPTKKGPPSTKPVVKPGPKPGAKIDHDSLRDLEQSIP